MMPTTNLPSPEMENATMLSLQARDNQTRSADIVASLRVAGRYYRFFLSGQVANANAGRSMRKICGLTGDDTRAAIAADEDEQGDQRNGDDHLSSVALPSVSRLKWDAVVEAGAFPFDDAARLMKTYRNAAGRRVQALAKQLPVYEWAASVRGSGLLNLGLIVGEIGDLSLYSNPAKVWKRMGLAVMPDGRAHRRVKGEQTGYSPARRTLMHNLGECLLKQNDGIYRAAYDERKAYEIARDSEIKPIAAHKRALRYMEKRWLRDLWREWRRVTAFVDMSTNVALPDPVVSGLQSEAKGKATPSESMPPTANVLQAETIVTSTSTASVSKPAKQKRQPKPKASLNTRRSMAAAVA